MVFFQHLVLILSIDYLFLLSQFGHGSRLTTVHQFNHASVNVPWKVLIAFWEKLSGAVR